jgi:hypothetical protein
MEAEKREKRLRALDELHRDATDQGGPQVHSRFDPYPLSPKRTFAPPPTREEILAAEAAAAEAEAEAKALAEEAKGEANRKPPLPKLDASLEGSEALRGVAGLTMAKRQADEEAAEEAARARRKAEREKVELARAKRAARLAALEAEESGVSSKKDESKSKSNNPEGSGVPGGKTDDGAFHELEKKPAGPGPDGEDAKTTSHLRDAGRSDSDSSPLFISPTSETDPKRRAIALMEAKAARNPLPGGGPSGLASDLRQPVVTEARPGGGRRRGGGDDGGQRGGQRRADGHPARLQALRARGRVPGHADGPQSRGTGRGRGALGARGVTTRHGVGVDGAV